MKWVSFDLEYLTPQSELQNLSQLRPEILTVLVVYKIS